jgi:hypothetical protein
MQTTDALIDIVLDAIEQHVKSHAELPEIVWCSEDLHRQIVLELPALIQGEICVCRSHTLRGLSAATVHRPKAPGEVQPMTHSGRKPAPSGEWSYDAGTSLPPLGPSGR